MTALATAPPRPRNDDRTVSPASGPNRSGGGPRAPRRAGGKGWRLAIVLAIGAVTWLSPAPPGLDPHAWAYFALFATVLAALVLEPLPGAVVGLVGITVATVFRLVAGTPEEALRWALSGFAHSTVWLIFTAFIFGLGYERTGLGRRIALSLVRWLGARTLGLGYAVALADLVLAPFIPSNTARSGGTIFPIIRSIPALYASAGEGAAGRMGAYLMWTAFAATGITSSMFLTANAANLFAIAAMREAAGITVSWTAWMMGFLPVGLLLFVSLPALVYVIRPPRVTAGAEVPAWAAAELSAMGRITRREMTMAAIAVGALVMWVAGEAWMSATAVGLSALGLMLLLGVVEWGDVVGHREAWNVLVWFAALVTLADGLGRVGFLRWFAAGATSALAGLPVTAILPLLVALFFVAHYMFASLTAHATTLLPVFLAAGAALPGMPVRALALALAYSIGLMGVLTPYATGPAPIYFASGYLRRGEFWTLGVVFGALYLAALIGVGVPYLLALAP